MDRRYWDQLAPRYDEEVFSVATNDRRGLIRSRLQSLSSKRRDILDLGCGIGPWLPLLSSLFRSVTAVDLSHRLLHRAREACESLGNVDFIRRDLSRGSHRLTRAHVILCVNAVLTPSLARRERLFDALAALLRPGGSLLLVVPALESALLTKQRLIEWNLRDHMAPHTAVRSALAPERELAAGWLDGIVPVDGVPTKHHLREELEMRLRSRGLEPLEFVKLEYPWSSEFAEPPRWMGPPYPWDWLVLARRGG
jgi:SAM-dependent methyltransferase